MDAATELLAYRGAESSYALSFVALLVARAVRRPIFTRSGELLLFTAFVLHTAALLLRWERSGQPPFITYHESVSLAVWLCAAVSLWLRLRWVQLGQSGVALPVVAAVLLAWADVPLRATGAPSAALQSTWLFVHAPFAVAAIACFLAAAAVAVPFLRGGRAQLPAADEAGSRRGLVRDTVHRLLLAGLLFQTAMLVSGAFWAHDAWGRYWGWDPIETWGLLTWLVYGLHLHLVARGSSDRVILWYAVCAALFAAFAYWGVGYTYATIHRYG